MPKLSIRLNCWYTPTVDTPQLLIRPNCRFAPTVDTPYPLIFPFFCYALHINMPSLLIRPFYQYTFSVNMPFPSVALSVDSPIRWYPISVDAKKLQRTSLLSAGFWWKLGWQLQVSFKLLMLDPYGWPSPKANCPYWFLGAWKHLYKRLRPSVGLLVCLSPYHFECNFLSRSWTDWSEIWWRPSCRSSFSVPPLLFFLIPPLTPLSPTFPPSANLVILDLYITQGGRNKLSFWESQ